MYAYFCEEEGLRGPLSFGRAYSAFRCVSCVVSSFSDFACVMRAKRENRPKLTSPPSLSHTPFSPPNEAQVEALILQQPSQVAKRLATVPRVLGWTW